MALEGKKHENAENDIRQIGEEQNKTGRRNETRMYTVSSRV